MREMGLQGASVGRRFKTTKPDSSGARPMDLVERDFNATRPNELWVSQCHVARLRNAFVIDVFARLIVALASEASLITAMASLSKCVGAGAASSADGNPEELTLVHHSVVGVQSVSIRYTERQIAEAGIEPSVGSRGDSYDNALAESIIGTKTE